MTDVDHNREMRLAAPYLFSPHHRVVTATRYGQDGIDLEDVIFSAKIDYVTLEVEPTVQLGPLDGKVRRLPSQHHRQRTIRDPSPADLRRLCSLPGPASVVEVEVAVDVRPRPRIAGTDRLKLLSHTMVDLFGLGLEPKFAEGMTNEFRACYRQIGHVGKVLPYNLRLPQPTDQQLHGGRQDACQVKAYLKRTDQHERLDPSQYAARVEVRLAGEELARRQIRTVNDLLGFKYRKQLMPFLTHISGTRRRQRHGSLPPKFQQQQLKALNNMDRDVFREVDAGGFRKVGQCAQANVRLLRNIAVNDRIGQALHRLEKHLRT